jgi:hypothetical protein
MPVVVWNSRSRFLEVMRFGQPDRVPYFEEGLREDTLRAWRKQGMPRGARIADLFPSDRREEPELDLRPLPEPAIWPKSIPELERFRPLLDAGDPARLPEDWQKHLEAGPDRYYTLMLRVHRGLFLSMGVRDWGHLTELMFLTKDDPAFVSAAMALQGEFAASFVERLSDVRMDAAVFSEPIGGNSGPLVSPRDYEEFALRNYHPVLQALRRCGVETIIFRTYANSRILIPSILKWGFNCLWACEAYPAAMDYRQLRREFGRELRLIGGIDLDALRRGKDAIRREVMSKAELVADGGYVPLADGRIRPDVPYENYAFYRTLMAKTMQLTSRTSPPDL